MTDCNHFWVKKNKYEDVCSKCGTTRQSQIEVKLSYPKKEAVFHLIVMGVYCCVFIAGLVLYLIGQISWYFLPGKIVILGFLMLRERSRHKARLEELWRLESELARNQDILIIEKIGNENDDDA